jgi:hypothetical protein
MEKTRENYEKLSKNSGQMAFMKSKDSSANGTGNVRNSNRSKGGYSYANYEPPPAPNVICYSAAITACERGGKHACRHCMHVHIAYIHTYSIIHCAIHYDGI